METQVMRFATPTLKTFYRCYILPLHIPKATKGSDRYIALSEELKRRKTEVKLMGLEKQCSDYVKAQEHKQATYDKYIELSGVFRADPSEENMEAWQLAETELADVRVKFRETYH